MWKIAALLEAGACLEGKLVRKKAKRAVTFVIILENN
jgi:hypothetical protein